MPLPELPAENEDPWFEKRQAFDLSVKDYIENLLATKVYVDAAVTALVNSSPAALDTLNELATALGNDPNFATTITNALAGKAPLTHSHSATDISSGTLAAARIPAASETAVGGLEVSDTAEAQGMSLNTRIITPARLASAASTTPVANRLARYSVDGRLQTATPSVAADAATKGYVDGVVIPPTLINAKGDLIVGASDDFPTRIGVGADGTFLIADSAEAVGVRWGNAPGGGDGLGQGVPEVNSFFTSAWFQSIGTSQLRDRSTSKMPLQLMEDISIDQAAFNLTVLAGTAGQTATIRLYELTGTTWTQLEILGSGIPLTDATGEKVVSFTPIALTAGVVYGLTLYEEQAYDTTVRVSQGALTGPAFGLGSGYGTGGQLLPVGSNASLIPANGIPVIKVRRSA